MTKNIYLKELSSLHEVESGVEDYTICTKARTRKVNTMQENKHSFQANDSE